MKIKIDIEKSKRHVANAAVWIGFGLLYSAPTLLNLDDLRALPFIVKSLLVCATVFYVNVNLLMPKFLFKNRRMFSYAIGVALTMMALIFVLYILSPWHERPILENENEDMPRPPFFVGWMLPMVGMFFVSTIYAYFLRDRKARKREIDLTHQNIEFEMKFLKSQINPHFLFNALNNIYALSVIKSERTPEMILKLSDMLRFTLYGSESKKVKVGREIEYIINFIEFQKLKMDSDPNIRIDTSNCNPEFLIEPMLMIPFIENSFKHGNIDNAKRGWLQMEMKTLGPILFFKVRNSLPSIAINKDVVGGIGVENVRKRLDILYPGRYELKIETTESAFSVYMKIDTFATE